MMISQNQFLRSQVLIEASLGNEVKYLLLQGGLDEIVLLHLLFHCCKAFIYYVKGDKCFKMWWWFVTEIQPLTDPVKCLKL